MSRSTLCNERSQPSAQCTRQTLISDHLKESRVRFANLRDSVEFCHVTREPMGNCTSHNKQIIVTHTPALVLYEPHSTLPSYSTSTHIIPQKLVRQRIQCKKDRLWRHRQSPKITTPSFVYNKMPLPIRSRNRTTA